jgi:UDP-N-acetylmuramoylalanine--D-glutamate ligase
VKLLGRHLLADVLAAAAVSTLAGAAADAMTRAVENFTGLEHALEPVAEIGGVQFVNDSKATNIEAARRAIESFGEGLVVVMGGRFKGGDFGELAGPLAARRATVVAMGEARPLIAAALGSACAVYEAADMAAAVRTAFACASPGRTVVLAPACASFDMFRDYADRGRVFKQQVRRLAEEWTTMREQ